MAASVITRAVICPRELGPMMWVTSSHVPLTIVRSALTTLSFVAVSSRFRTSSVTFGLQSDTLPYSLTNFCNSSWKALRLQVELLKARKPFEPAVFLTVWIVTSTSSGLTFCLRSFTICAYVIPSPGVITTELNAGLFFQAWGTGILEIPSFFPSLFYVLFFLFLITSTKSSVIAGVPGVLFSGCFRLSDIGFSCCLKFVLISGVPSFFKINSTVLRTMLFTS